MPDVILTSKKNQVKHRHPENEPANKPQGDFNEVSKELGRRVARKVLDGSEFETLGDPTRRFNCYSYAFTESHGWVVTPGVAIADDFVAVTGAPEKGDVLLYMNEELLSHTAVVEKVGDDGSIVKVRSKWGELGLFEHLPDVVPPEYGIPVLVLRRKGEVSIPGPADESSAAVEGEGEGEADAAPDDSPLEALDDELKGSAMLASSPAARDRIVRTELGLRPPGGASRGELLLAVGGPPVEGGTPPPGDGVDHDAIDELLTALLAPEVHMRLLFASTTGVARRIITSLEPVRQLTALTRVGEPAPVHAAIGAATLRFFRQHGAQNDDKLSSILFHLLKNSPVREAAEPLARYVLESNPVGLARTLAVEAFSAAAVS